jgi:hypothetical protein
MDHMIVGECALRSEIDVASVTVAEGPFVAMLVAAEACGHLRQYGVGSCLGDLDMAVNAVAIRGEHMARVRETELRARELDGLPDIRLAVAALAGSLVVRLLVAAAASGIRRKMRRRALGGYVDARVAFDAVDPLENVRAVLERVRGRLVANTEDTRAGGERDREQHDQREPRPHRISSARETRSKPSAS